MDTAVDFLASVLDEVSLEGLEGITLPTLWLRLGNRPHFPISLDEDSKIFLWECIAVHKEVEIWELPKPRPVISLFNRFDHIDIESGSIYEPADFPKDIYSVQPVTDGEVWGSCSTYKTRKCITSDIRYDSVLLLSLSQVVERWGDSLILVASPKCRLLALAGTSFNPLSDMSIEEYCLLERIGRSRYLGETSHGDSGLTALKASFSKQLHYHRKKLSCKGLVTMQQIYLRNRKGYNGNGRLFHLTRFYVLHRSILQSLVKNICDYLQEKPLKCEETKIVREGFKVKDKNFKKLFHPPFSKWLKIASLPYRDLYPEAPEKDCVHLRGNDRIIKVVQLVKEYDENEDEETAEVNDKRPLEHNYFDFTKLYHDLPLTTQAYIAIKGKGSDGITGLELAKIMTLPRLDIRNLARNLLKRGIVQSFLQDRGKQKERRYISKEYAALNKNCSQLMEENENMNKTVSTATQSKKRPGEEDNSTPKAKKVKFNDVVNTVIYEREEGNLAIVTESPRLDFENIKTDLIQMQNVNATLSKDKVCGSLDKSIQNSKEVKSVRGITMRFIKRAKMVLEFLKTVELTSITEVQKYLTDKEKEEGYCFKIDSRSTKRIINKLTHEKKINLFKATLNLEGDTKDLDFICHTSVEATDVRIEAAIEQAKFKYYSVGKNKVKKTKTVKEKPGDEDKRLEGKENLADKNLPKKNLVFQPSVGRLFYGLQPKFIRAKTLHLFLCYLTRGYEGSLENIGEEPLIYNKCMSWKRYVPPLTDYNKKEGWCFLADAISRMPLSVFLKVVNIRYEIPGIDQYLGQEGREHYLIKHLPQELRNDLLHDRKYLFMITEVVKQLCYMGLVTFGPQVQKLKDQVYVHVHKKVQLLDTTTSTPGYTYINKNLSYPIKSYEFNSTDDADAYWISLETICLHTPLGRYGMIAGKTITFTEVSHKSEMIEALKSKDFSDVHETNEVPGDGLGAAGLDSSLFAHLKRNWCWGSIPWLQGEKVRSNGKEPLAACPMQSLLQTNELLSHKKAGRLMRLTKNTSLTEPKANQIKSNVNAPKSNRVSKRKSGVRTLSRKSVKKPRRPYYDDKDQVALKKMSKFRCDWTAQEDSFLLLCKVASSFLDPKSRRLVVPYAVIRDMLQEHLPALSANKSSRACQRRVIYMMRNPTTTNNVAVFLGESKQDKSLVDEFAVTKPPLSNEIEWKRLFTSLVKKLMTKFTMSASDRCKFIILPQTLSEFNKHYEVNLPSNVFCTENPYKEPKSVEDICSATLYALIVSSMAIVDEGSKWSYTLHKLYETYPESLLRSIVSRLRKDKIIAAKKCTSKKELQRVHSSSIPFRFSITYDNNLITKFPSKIYSESSELMKMMSPDSSPKIEITGKVSCGYTAAILSLLITGNVHLHTEVPDQVILFDTTLSKEVRSNIVERMIQTLSIKESDELTKLLSNEISSGSTSLQRNSELLEATNDKSLSSTQCNSKSLSLSETHNFTNASRFALYMLRQECSQAPIERIQHSQDYIVLNSCKVFCELVQNVIFSDNSYPILPPKVCETDSIRKNAIIYNSDISREIVSSTCSYIPRQAFSNDQNYEKSLQIIYEVYSSATLDDAQYIFDAILQSKELGVPVTVLLKEFRELSGELPVFEHLNLFIEAKLIFRVGVLSFRYVVNKYAKQWVIHSFQHKTIIENSIDNINKSAAVNTKIEQALVSNAGLHESNSSTLSEQTGLVKDPLTVTAANELGEGKSCDVFQKSQISVITEEENSSKNSQLESMIDIDKDLNADNQGSSNSSKEEIFLAQTTVYEDVHFIPRTWRKPDGSLNVAEFFKLLLTVLSYIISTPGVDEQRVCERFAGVLQPVQTLELIEVLETIHCIYKYFCKPVVKRSLFSPLPDLYVFSNAEPEFVTHLESFPHAIFKVTKLQEQMTKLTES